MPRPLRCQFRPLRRLRVAHQGARRGRGPGVSRGLRAQYGELRGFPQPLQDPDAGGSTAPGSGIDCLMDYAPQDLIAVSASRLLGDRKVVFAGVGMPLMASVLARGLHAPHLTIVLEGRIIGPEIEPGALPISTNEMRAARRAMMLTDIIDIFLNAQRGFFDY